MSRTEAPQTTEDGEHPAPPAPGPWTRRLVVAGLLAAAFNLRPAVTSLGPLLEEVRAGLHMSGTVAGLLTSVPVLCFSLFGTAAPRLARRFGPAVSSTRSSPPPSTASSTAIGTTSTSSTPATGAV